MYSGLKYLVQTIISSPGAIITICQVGSPIRRSLGIASILDFPKLIAEYHVLHRLLLPRHSPNALLALDLVQKETVLQLSGLEAGSLTRPSVSEPKSILSRASFNPAHDVDPGPEGSTMVHNPCRL